MKSSRSPIPLDDAAAVDEMYDSKYGAGVPLSHPGFSCDVCGGEIENCATRFYCVECDERQTSWDMCEKCFHREGHAHTVVARNPSHPRPTIIHQSLALSLRNRFLCYRDRRCLAPDARRCSRGSDWATFAEVYASSRELATSLSGVDSVPSSSVAIFSANSVRWCIADFACVFAGLVSAPVPSSFSPAQAAAAIVKANSSVLFVDSRCAQRLASPEFTWPRCLLTIVFMSDDQSSATSSEIRATAASLGREVVTWREVLTGTLSPTEWRPIKARLPNELATVLFTSGSTSGGEPRAVACPERILGKDFGHPLSSPSIQLAFQPLSYTSQRLLMYSLVGGGGRAAFASGEMVNIFEEARLVRLTFFQAPPRVWSVLKERFEAEAAEAQSRAPPDRKAQARDRVIREYGKALGDRVDRVSIGSAAPPPGILEWMRECFPKISVTEGFGTTESGMISRDGVILEGVFVRLEDVPELGYFSTDKPHPRGVLWVKTSTATSGYLGEPELTAHVFKDGWVNTGDVVEFDAPGRKIKIINRAKVHFKLSQGSFVSPERLESIYGASPLVETIVIHGEPEWDQVVALVIPREHVLRQRLSPPLPESFASLIKAPGAAEVILAELREIGRREGIQQFEVPRAVLLESGPWTEQTGFLTSSLKMNRLAIVRHFSADLRAVYTSSPQQGAPSATVQPEPREIGEFEATVKEMASQIFGSPPGLDDPLSRLGFDSLAAMKLVGLLQRRFRARIDVSSLYRAGASVRTLAAELLLATRAPPPGGAAPDEVDWNLEAALHPEIGQLLRCRRHCQKIRSGVLITGATGFVGSHLLLALATSCRDDLFCLCRSPSDLDGITEKLKVPRQNVIPIKGDLREFRFGLAEAEWDKLSKDVGTIFHVAAQVSFALPYSALRLANVNGTMEVLRLASTGHSKRVVHVSSLSALCPPEDFPAKDFGFEIGRLSLDPCPRMGGYGASKRVAEALMRDAIDHYSLDGVVVRLGTVGADSRTGSCGKGDLVFRLLHTIATTGLAPDVPDAVISMAPVDWIARALVCIGAQGSSEMDRAYTLVSDGPTLRQLVEMMAAIGIPVKFVSADRWREVLKGSQLEPFESMFSGPRFPYDSKGEGTAFCAPMTTGLLEANSIEPPSPMTPELLKKIFQVIGGLSQLNPKGPT